MVLKIIMNVHFPLYWIKWKNIVLKVLIYHEPIFDLIKNENVFFHVYVIQSFNVNISSVHIIIYSNYYKF